MIIFPAIDMKEGQVVRLRQGDPNQKTVYSSDPVEVAKHWQAMGAAWLHMVNLDGALDQNSQALAVVEKIASIGIKIQYGGGLRSAENVAQAISSGVSRVILGTMAVENPDLTAQLIQKHGSEAIVVALDAKNGKVATHGWQTESAWTAVDLGKVLAEKGLRHALYTDIHRDGQLEGVNIPATRQLARETGLQIIASGGLRSIEDVKALAEYGDIYGVILGKALYEGMIDLQEALQITGKSA